jgi:hypothetical protein
MSTAGSIADQSPGTDVRRRSPLQRPGPVQPPVLRDAAMYLTSGQTNGQGIVQRKFLYFHNKSNTSKMNVLIVILTTFLCFRICVTV